MAIAIVARVQCIAEVLSALTLTSLNVQGAIQFPALSKRPER
jgi:hypothetical protein